MTDVYLGNQFNFFQPHVQEFNYYPSGSWNSQPTITFLAGLAACVLLGFVIREEDVETLMTVSPIDVILYRKRPPDEPLMRTASHVIFAVVLQAAWSCRALIVPTFVALGTSVALAGSTDALDVVLNSVAAGFILEVDDYIMPALVGEDEASAFEERPIDDHGEPILALKHRLRLVPLYSWLLYGVNTTILFLLFGQRMLNQFLPTSIFAYMDSVVMLTLALRGGLFAIAHVHMALALRLPPAVLLMRTIPSALITSLGCIYLAHVLYQEVLQRALGWAFYQEAGSPLINCLQMFSRSDGECTWDANGNMKRLTGLTNPSDDTSGLKMGSYAYGDAAERYGSQYTYGYG